LNIVRRKIELKCLSEKIPEAIIIDLDGIEIGESFKISSVKLEEGVTPTIIGRDFVIATLAAPTVVKETEKPAEAEATDEKAEDGKDATAVADGDKKEIDEKKSPEEKK
jgi:large subunit ribosomal protein L25